MKRALMWVVLAASVTLLPAVALAAEHGGTPMGGAAEHPGQQITSRSVKKSITDHVKELTAGSKGVLTIKDDKLGKEWKLKLDKVHDPVRKFEKEGQTIYFACSDFKALDGKDILDIDFWMVEKDGTLKVIDTKIHKVNGEPRYTYEGTELKEIK